MTTAYIGWQSYEFGSIQTSVNRQEEIQMVQQKLLISLQETAAVQQKSLMSLQETGSMHEKKLINLQFRFDASIAAFFLFATGLWGAASIVKVLEYFDKKESEKKK